MGSMQGYSSGTILWDPGPLWLEAVVQWGRGARRYEHFSSCRRNFFKLGTSSSFQFLLFFGR